MQHQGGTCGYSIPEGGASGPEGGASGPEESLALFYHSYFMAIFSINSPACPNMCDLTKLTFRGCLVYSI